MPANANANANVTKAASGKPGGLRGTLNFQRSTGDTTLVRISPEPSRPSPILEPIVAVFMARAGVFALARHGQRSLAFGARISSPEKTVGTSLRLHGREYGRECGRVNADDGLVLEGRGERGGHGASRRRHGP